jgi:DNA-binding NarL/FixJ family response regulator
MNPLLRTLLFDDHRLLRQSLVGLLESEGDIQVLGSLCATDAALGAARSSRPQVISVDIDMPGRVCFESARDLEREEPEVHVLFLSVCFHDRCIEAALRCNASGYLTKDQSGAELAETIRRTAEGLASFSEQAERGSCSALETSWRAA